MSAENLLCNKKVSWLFFHLVNGPASAARLARKVGLSASECHRLLELMRREGLVEQRGKNFAIDWQRFVPLFLRFAMQVLPLAMPWLELPAVLDSQEEDITEAACARAERSLARLKVSLSNNDLFLHLVQAYFQNLVQEAWAPQDYLEDLRVMDVIQEFEIGLLKLQPLLRGGKNRSRAARQLQRIFRLWYRALQGYDSPAGAALRSAFVGTGLMRE